MEKIPKTVTVPTVAAIADITSMNLIAKANTQKIKGVEHTPSLKKL
jgi:hypothetical protein